MAPSPQSAGSVAPPKVDGFDSLARLLPCGVVLLDDEMDLRHSSPRTAELLGREPDDIDRRWPSIRDQLPFVRSELSKSKAPQRATAVINIKGKGHSCRFEVYPEQGNHGLQYLMLIYPGAPELLQTSPVVAAGKAITDDFLSHALLHDFSATSFRYCCVK